MEAYRIFQTTQGEHSIYFGELKAYLAMRLIKQIVLAEYGKLLIGYQTPKEGNKKTRRSLTCYATASPQSNA